MSAEARYFRVGLFLLVGIASVVVALLVLGSRWLDRDPVLLETYFEESVQGLDVGSAVKLRGVPIGDVKSITFVGDAYDLPDATRLSKGSWVRVVIRAKARDEQSAKSVKGTLKQLVGSGMRLRLTAAGLTGTAFLQADLLGAAAPPPLAPDWTPEYVYVPSAPSTLAQFTSAAERLMARVEKLDVEGLIAHLDTLLVSLTTGADQLDMATIQGRIEQILLDMQTVVRALGDDMRAADMGALAGDARALLGDARATLATVKQSVDGGSYDLELALENMRVASENLRELSATLRQQPSLLLRSAAPEEPEP